MGVIFINPYRFAAFSPLDLSPQAWYDASDTSTITSSGSPATVSQWNDKSGNGRNVTQPTAASQPGTGTTTQNSLNVLTFDGNDTLQAATASQWRFLHNGTQYIFAGVMKANSSAINQVFFSTQIAAAQEGFYWGHLTTTYNHQVSAQNTGSGVTVVGNGNSGAGTSPYIVSALADPSNATAANRSSVHINAGAAGKNNTATGTPTNNDANSLLFGARGATLLMSGWIGEVVFVSGANATEANRVALRDYLNAKWAVY